MGIFSYILIRVILTLTMDRHFLLLAAVVVAAQAFFLPSMEEEGLKDKRWEMFKRKYNKVYPQASEEAKRHAIWYNNTQLIHAHNELYKEGKTTFRLGPNSNMDLTAKEFAARFNGFKNKTGFAGVPEVSDVDIKDLPAEVDWVKKMLIPLVSLEVVEEVTGPVVLTTQTATVIATMFSAVMTTAVEEDTTTTASTGLRLCSAVLLTMDTWQSQAVKRNMTSSRRDSLFLMVMFTLDTG